MEWVAAAIQWVAHMGAWAPLAFIAAYVIASILLAPSFLLTFAAGALFGLWRGTILVYVGAVLGGSAVYWLASPLSGSRHG